MCIYFTLCKSLAMATSDPLIGSAEVCERLRIDRSTLTRRVARGEITPVQKLPGETGAYLFEAGEVARAEAEQAKAATS